MTSQNLELFPGDLFARKGDAAPAGDKRKSKAAAAAIGVSEPEPAAEPEDPEASEVHSGSQQPAGGVSEGPGAATAKNSGKRRGKARRSKSTVKGPSADAAPAASVLEFRLLDEVSDDLDEILRCAEGRAQPSSEPEQADEASTTETSETDVLEAEASETRLPEVDATVPAPAGQSSRASVSRMTLAGTVAASVLLIGVVLAGWFATRPDPMPSPESAAPSAILDGDSSAFEAGPTTESHDQGLSASDGDTDAPVDGQSQGPVSGYSEGAAPRLDVVRVEDDGSAVIAGIAAPGTEVIVLHNDAPIGVAKADAFGEWVLLPEAPLAEGPHEFGLVVKSVEGSVTLPDAPPPESEVPTKADDSGGEASDAPALDQESRLPAPEAKPAQAHLSVPLPPQKPIAGSSPQETGLKAAYVVQLASAPSAVGAASEWQRLRKAYPELLAQQDLSLQEADLAGRGAVFRVRTGSFETLAEARQFCAAFRRQKQACLVVKRTDAKGTVAPRTRLTRYDSW